MDLQKIISDLVSKLTGNNDLIASFTADPLKAVKDLLGIDLDTEQIAKVVQGVTEKLGISMGDVVKEGAGLLGKIKSLFGGK